MLPTENDIKNWVDEIITPENADFEAKRLTQILNAVACRQDDERWNLTVVATRHAFTKTLEFEEAFREFAEIGEFEVYPAADSNIEFEYRN